MWIPGLFWLEEMIQPDQLFIQPDQPRQCILKRLPQQGPIYSEASQRLEMFQGTVWGPKLILRIDRSTMIHMQSK